MNNRLNLYKIWAPDGSPWTVWAKPVLFASMPRNGMDNPAVNSVEAPITADPRTAVVVDLPGRQSVDEALAFAAKGWRPVPLYNGVIGPGTMLVDALGVGGALAGGADMLRQLRLSPDAPPVFMLDSGRMNGPGKPNTFDNRWCVFPQDMPSAQFLKSRGIERVVARSDGVRPDLERILLDYQKSGILLFTLGAGEPKPQPYTAGQRSLAAGFAYRFMTIIGLKRNAAGGFGATIPDPYSGGRGVRYYGFG